MKDSNLKVSSFSTLSKALRGDTNEDGETENKANREKELWFQEN